MNSIYERQKQLIEEVLAAPTIDKLKNLREEFRKVCFDFADLHKNLESGQAFNWYKRFEPVIGALDKAFLEGNFEWAGNSILSNIEAMLNFKKDPNHLMNYLGFKNENSTVDRIEKIVYLKLNKFILDYDIPMAFLLHRIVWELENILSTIDPLEKNKKQYENMRDRIKNNSTILFESASKWSKAIRPTDITKLDFSRFKTDLYCDLGECVRLLEEE